MSWYINNRWIRRFSDWNARLLGHSTTANMISVQRILFGLIAVVFLQTKGVYIALALYLFAVYLDFVDGAVARYQQDLLPEQLPAEEERKLNFLDRLRHPGVTEMGKWLDPLADKTINQLMLFALGWNYLPHMLLYGCLGMAILLTLLRPMKKRLKLGDGRANGFGKTKMWTEVVLILCLFLRPEALGLMIPHLVLSIVLAIFAIGLAVLSFTFHLLPAQNKKPSS